MYQDGSLGPISPRYKIGEMHVLPGSFNPLHAGHRYMYESIDEDNFVIQGYGRDGYAVAATVSDKFYEISTSRIGKEDLDSSELLKRLSQFHGYAKVLVTDSPLFRDKCDYLKPHADKIIFHVGYDTYERLVNMSEPGEVESLDCFFCVWSRDGKSITRGPRNCYASPVDLPANLQGISSTKIRSSGG